MREHRGVKFIELTPLHDRLTQVEERVIQFFDDDGNPMERTYNGVSSSKWRLTDPRITPVKFIDAIFLQQTKIVKGGTIQ